MDKIKLLIKYLVYRISRRGAKGHGIHSPFVYELNRKVLNCRNQYPEYQELKLYRRNLQSMKEMITVEDHGAGSRVFTSSSRRVSDITTRSGSSYRMGKLLFRLARSLQPAVVIELGTSVGFGTFCLAKGAMMAKVYSLEACPSQNSIAGRELARASISNAELIARPFITGLPELLGRVGRVDLVYFDGDHRKESFLWQFARCREKASEDSVFVVGDINWSGEMAEAWSEVCRDPAVSVSIDLFDCGILYFRKGIAKQHFVLGFS